MTSGKTISGLALMVAAGWALPAQAQASDAAGMQQELQAMRAQMEAMAQRINTLEAQLETTSAKADAAGEAAQVASATATQAATQAADSAKAASDTTIAWKGAPLIESKSGWSFKPRGRLNIDAGFVDAPDSTGREDGFGSEMRRARLGVEGDIPGGFGYKFEVDFAGNATEVTDASLSYADGPLTLTVGQHNNFQGLEELSSSRHTSFIERAAFTDAFGFERRLGVSAQAATGDVLVQAGIFSDNIGDTPNKNWSLDGRAVYMPKFGDTQLHLGGSAHMAMLEDGSTVRYRQRPLVHFTSERFINTGSMPATRETGYGLEAAAIAGPLSVAAEGFWQTVSRPGLDNPTFFGGYVEAGYFLTPGDTRGYKNGLFDRVKPKKEVGEGGIGAISLNARYDFLDLNDAGIVGGKQDGYEFSLVWSPTDYTRMFFNYAKLSYTDAVYSAAGGDTSYDVDAFGVRAQVDF